MLATWRQQLADSSFLPSQTNPSIRLKVCQEYAKLRSPIVIQTSLRQFRIAIRKFRSIHTTRSCRARFLGNAVYSLPPGIPGGGTALSALSSQPGRDVPRHSMHRLHHHPRTMVRGAVFVKVCRGTRRTLTLHCQDALRCGWFRGSNNFHRFSFGVVDGRGCSQQTIRLVMGFYPSILSIFVMMANAFSVKSGPPGGRAGADATVRKGGSRIRRIRSRGPEASFHALRKETAKRNSRSDPYCYS
jgi:hypothetical protein